MRVLMICPELPSPGKPGGMAPTQRQFQSLRDQGIEVETIDMRGPKMLKYLQVLPRLHRQLRDADVVHAHYGFCGWLGRTQFSKPLVLSFMGSDLHGDALDSGKPRLRSRLEAFSNRRLLAKCVKRVIVKSQAMAQLLAPVECAVIPNGVDTEAFHPTPMLAARSRLGWATDRQIVLFPGNPNKPNKGFPFAVQVIEQVQAQMGKPVELVPLWGVPPDQVPLTMNACDAMLLASFAEGSPNVVKEAMACNLPVVASPVGDVPELLQGVHGNCVCPRDVASTRDAMLSLLRSPRASAGRERVLQRQLSLPDVAKKIIAVYQSVLQPAATKPKRVVA